MTNDQIKFAIQMAGLLASANTDSTCSLQCQVGNLSKNVSVSVGSDGKAVIPGTVNLAIQQKKQEFVTAGAAALKVDPVVQSSLNTVSAALASEIQTAVQTAETNKESSTTTQDPASVLAANGLQGFIDAMRKGFKDTETRLIAAEEDLSTRYKDVSLDGLGLVGKVLDAVDSDCDSETLVCTTQSQSLFKWTGSSGNYSFETKQADSAGRTFKGNLVGSKSSNGTMTATINGDITLAGAKVVTMTDLAVSMYNPAGEDFTATIKGTLVASDTQSSVKVTLAFNDIAVQSKPRTENANLADLSFKGSLSISSSLGDKLTGSIDAKMVELTKRIDTGYGNFYNDYEEFVTDATISLKAEKANTGGGTEEIALLSVTGSSSLPDYTKPVSETNVEKYRGTISLALADKLTSLSFTESTDTWKTIKQVAKIKSGTSEVQLTADYSSDKQSGSWCFWNQIKRCTDTLELVSTNPNPYKATLTKNTSGKTQGKIFLGDVQVGEIVNGIMKINGAEVSLY